MAESLLGLLFAARNQDYPLKEDDMSKEQTGNADSFAKVSLSENVLIVN